MGANDEKEKNRQAIQVSAGGQGFPKTGQVWVEGFEEDGPAAILHPWGFWVSPDFEIHVEATTTGQLVRVKPTENYRFKVSRRQIEATQGYARGSADR